MPVAIRAATPGAGSVLSRGRRLALLNCAGQGCDERRGCRRYRTRLPSGEEQGRKLFSWASFDIERLRFGDCPAQVPA